MVYSENYHHELTLMLRACLMSARWSLQLNTSRSSVRFAHNFKGSPSTKHCCSNNQLSMLTSIIKSILLAFFLCGQVVTCDDYRSCKYKLNTRREEGVGKWKGAPGEYFCVQRKDGGEKFLRTIKGNDFDDGDDYIEDYDEEEMRLKFVGQCHDKSCWSRGCDYIETYSGHEGGVDYRIYDCR